MAAEKKMKQFSFKAKEDLIEEVKDRIDKENKKIKDWDKRKNLSRKINELLYDYISR